MIYEAKNTIRGKATVTRDIRKSTTVLNLTAENDDEAAILAAALRQITLSPAITKGNEPEIICTSRTDRTKYVLRSVNVKYERNRGETTMPIPGRRPGTGAVMMTTIYGTPPPCELVGILSPCPFCGGIDLFIADKFAVECNNRACDASGPLALTVEGAIAVWNGRAKTTMPVGRRRAVRGK